MTPPSPAPPSHDLDSGIEQLARSLLASTPEPLRESMLYSLLGPGKRIRPRLVAAVGAALGLPPEGTARIGAALEMVHAFTLVHDDLPAMDNDDLRRGRPTNHKVYGEATALLAGDGLALLAVDALLPLRKVLPAERVFAVIEALLEAAGARGVIAGQVAESLLSPGDPVEQLWEVFRLKTGALFRAALVLPSVAAGSTFSEELGKLGEAIGIAFQIADDLEDDFAKSRGNSRHVAGFLEYEEARGEGLRIIRQAAQLIHDPRLKSALEPFITELEKKLNRETAIPSQDGRR